MKRILIKIVTDPLIFLFPALLIALLFSGCKKDFAGWEDLIKADGSVKFIYHYELYGDVPWNKPIPKQPFTVDSIRYGEYGDQGQYNGYWVSNADGLHFTLPPVDIRPYITH